METTIYKAGDTWTSWTGLKLTVMAVVNGYCMLRYKGCSPFIKSVKEMPKFINFVISGPSPNPANGGKE